MTSFSRLLRQLPAGAALLAMAITAPARGAQADGESEIHFTADLDGDGREDIVVLDRASGGFRAAYQNAPGIWNWSPARATGMTGITGAAPGKWFATNRECFAVVSPAANRSQFVRAGNPAEQPVITKVFTPGLGPSAVAAPDIGGPGNTAHSDLWLASLENGAPNPVRIDTVRHEGAAFTNLLQAASARTPLAVRTVALKTGGLNVVCFLGALAGQDDRFTAISHAGGTAAEVLAATVPEGSSWTSGRVAAGALHHVLTWVAGENSLRSHAVAEGPPNIFSLAAAQTFAVGIPIGGVAIVATDAGTRLIITHSDGTHAEVYSFNGVSPPVLVQQIIPPAGQGLTAVLPLATGGFQLMQGAAGSGSTTTMVAYTAGGGVFSAGAASVLPGLRPAAMRANVFAFASEPFVDPGARLLARFNAPEWTSDPVLLGNQLSVSRETFANPSSGLGGKAGHAIGTVPVGTAFVLTNQLTKGIAVHSFDGGDGAAGADVEISPVPGTQTRAIYLDFQASPANAAVFFRFDNGPWTQWPGDKAPVWSETTVSYYARHPVTQQPSPIRRATYRFDSPPHELDSDGDGVPDFVEIHLGLDPLAGNDTDGDGYSDLNEILLNTKAGDAAITPTPAQRLEENVAFKLRVAPRPIDGSSGSRVTAALETRLEAFGLNGALIASGRTMNLATPGVTGAGLWSDSVVADGRLGMISVLTQPIFPVVSASPDKERGREMAGLFFIPKPVPPSVDYAPGGGTPSEEAIAWSAAAASAWNSRQRPTVAGEWDEVDTLAALLLEWKIEQVLLARGLAGLEPGRLTLFGGRPGDVGRFPPQADDLASLRLRASADIPGYDLARLFEEIEAAVTGGAALSTARAAATAVYRVSSAHSNAAPPGTYVPPFDVLRAFVRGQALGSPYNAQVGLAPAALAGAQQAMQALVGSLPGRPVETLTLIVQADSFTGGCHRLRDKLTAAPVNLFASPGVPYHATDGFSLIPGTELFVTGYVDLEEACPGTDMEVISVSVASFPPPASLDQNNNLLPDAWEWAFLLGDGKPFDDDDNDGIPNLQEYLDGSDPLDPDSGGGEGVILVMPQLQIVQDGLGGISLWWEFPAKYAALLEFKLEISEDLIHWQATPAVVIQPEPGLFMIEMPDVMDSNPDAFQRIVMSLKGS